MNFDKIRSLMENYYKNIKVKSTNDTLHDVQKMCIESDRSTNKLNIFLRENNLRISLENEIGTPIEEYDTTVISSDDLVDKIKDAINLYDMIDDLNIDFDNNEEVPEGDFDVGDDIEEGCLDTECDVSDELELSDPVADFDNDGEDETLLNEETNPFSEIIDMMSNAESYDELYTAAGLIKDEKLRTDVETLIGQCEDDGDDVETAYSVVTSDLLDNKTDELNEDKSELDKSVSALDEIDRLANGDEKLAKLGRELGLKDFKKYLKDNNLLKESVDEFEASKYKGNEWGVFAKKSRAWVLFGTEKEMKDKAKELNSRNKNECGLNNVEEDIESDEVSDIPEVEETDILSELSSIQDTIVSTSKRLSDLAQNSNDVDIMSIVMDLANGLSSSALDIEDAIETIDELDPDEELEEVGEKDKTEEMLVKFRNSVTESVLLAKKIKNTNDVDKEIFENYIKSVNKIL